MVIFGTSDLGQKVDFYLSNDSTFEVVAYTISKEALKNNPLKQLNNKPIVPFEEVDNIYPPNKYQMFVAIGYAQMNKLRKRFIEAAEAKKYSLISYICSSTTKWHDLEMQSNAFIFEDNSLQPGVRIGKGVILSRGNSIGHDSVIEDYCFLANHTVLCGHCIIGTESFIGSNATIADGVAIAPKNLVGAAAFIKRNTNPEEVFITPQTEKCLKKSDSFFNW